MTVKNINTGIVFIPKIGEHLKKSAVRVDGYSQKEINQVIKLRAENKTHKECGKIISRPQGSIGNMIFYYKLEGAINDAKALLEKTV